MNPVPVTLAVWGDPVVGRALALLLRSSCYDARFLPMSSPNEPRLLEGVELLLLTLTPGLSVSRREALLKPLQARAMASGIPVLELVVSTFKERVGEEKRGAAGDGPGRVVSWPCSTEELKRRIDAALIAY